MDVHGSRKKARKKFPRKEINIWIGISLIFQRGLNNHDDIMIITWRIGGKIKAFYSCAVVAYSFFKVVSYSQCDQMLIIVNSSSISGLSDSGMKEKKFQPYQQRSAS